DELTGVLGVGAQEAIEDGDTDRSDEAGLHHVRVERAGGLGLPDGDVGATARGAAGLRGRGCRGGLAIAGGAVGRRAAVVVIVIAAAADECEARGARADSARRAEEAAPARALLPPVAAPIAVAFHSFLSSLCGSVPGPARRRTRTDARVA